MSSAPVAVASELVSVEEYLSSSYKPACDYLDGILKPKPMPTWLRGVLQCQIAFLINSQFPRFSAATEVTIRMSETRFRVPDIIAQHRDKLQSPYPTEPVHLCIESLSPEDRFSEIVGKCEEYLAWGVPTVWIVDPEERRAWQMDRSATARPHETATLTAGPVTLPCSAIFSLL